MCAYVYHMCVGATYSLIYCVCICVYYMCECYLFIHLLCVPHVWGCYLLFIYCVCVFMCTTCVWVPLRSEGSVKSHGNGVTGKL